MLIRLSWFCSSSGASAFQAMQYLPHQQPGYPVHSHFTSQPGQFTWYCWNILKSYLTWYYALSITTWVQKALLISCRIYSWSRDPPPETAGTCQPTVRLYWCCKIFEMLSLKSLNGSFPSCSVTRINKCASICLCIMVTLSGCFEAYASSCHASFCSWTIGHTSNGSPDSYCKGESLKHLLHFTPSLLHQWIKLRFLLSLMKMQLQLCSENILSLTLNCSIPFSSPVPVPELPSECSSSQLPPPQSEQPEVLPPRKITRSHSHYWDFTASLMVLKHF